MYTIDCEDPNCVKCLQDSKDQSSEEENQNKMAFEELVSNDMLLANEKRARCLAECREMKDEIQSQIGQLIAIFRERERELCIQVEKGFKSQMAIIDHDATVQCMDKILKRNSEPLKPPRRLVFKYDVEPTWTDLKNFGQLTYEEVPERVLKQKRDMFEGFSVRMNERLSKKKNLYFYVDDSGKFSRKAMQEMVARIEEMTQNFDKLHLKENQKPKADEEPSKRLDDSKTSCRLMKRPKPIRVIESFDNLNKRVEDEGRYFDDGTTSTSGEVFRLDKLSDEKLEMLVKDLVEKRKRYEQARLAMYGKEAGKDISSKERKRSKDDSGHFGGIASMPRVKVEISSLSDDETVKNAVKELNEEAAIKLRKRHGPTFGERRRYEEARLAWYGKEAVRVSVPDLNKMPEDKWPHFEEGTASASSAKVETGSFMDYEAMKNIIETVMEGKKRSGPKMEGRKAYEQARIPLFGKEVVKVPDLNKSSEDKWPHFEEGTASVSSAKVEMGGNFMDSKTMKSLIEIVLEGRKSSGRRMNESNVYEHAERALFGKEVVKDRSSVLDLNKGSNDKGQHFEEGTASLSSALVGMKSLSEKLERAKEKLEMHHDPAIEEKKRYDEAMNAMYGKEVVKDRSDVKFFLLANLQNEQKKRLDSARLALYDKEAEKDDISVLDLNKSSKDEGQHFEEGTASVSSAEAGMDSLSDEDMEIISKNEAATIPSESPPLPPKDRFRFGRKRSWGPSLFFRKPLSPENNSPSEKPIPDARAFQESLAACFSRHKHVSEEPPSSNVLGLQDPLSTRLAMSNDDDDSRKEMRTSGALLLSQDERKEIPFFNEPSSQESSSECLGDSNAEGQGHDPSAALLSSFKKYLEKNPESEWLVREKSSEQSLSAGNSCIDNFNQWLSTNNE